MTTTVFNDGLTAAINTLTTYLDEHPTVELEDHVLAELWDVVTHITGRARPVYGWTPGAWTRYQAMNR